MTTTSYRDLLFFLLISTGTLTAAAPPARAETLLPGRDAERITAIGGGVWELGLDNVLLLRYEKVETTSGSYLGTAAQSVFYAGGPTLRVFVVDNLSLALNISGFVRQTSVETGGGGSSVASETTESGVFATLMVAYNLRLGGSLFFRPALGGGGFYGRTTTRDVADSVTSFASFGGAARLSLDLVYYVSRHFNLKAGVDILGTFGKQNVEKVSTQNDFTGVDAGFNIGFNYVF